MVEVLVPVRRRPLRDHEVGGLHRGQEERPLRRVQHGGKPRTGDRDGGRAVAYRMAVDHLRLAVAPTPATDGRFHVEIHVNDVEMTAAGAGLGMDTFDLLIPDNLLLATDQPRRVPVARCGCGIYGCGATAAVIQRVGDTVRWEWQAEKPMDRDAVFNATAYEIEVLRAAADHRWETPERTAGRLVLEAVDRRRLDELGLVIDGAGNHPSDPTIFRTRLLVPGAYYIDLDFDWDERSPAEVADEACRCLALDPPAMWPARWSGSTPATSGQRPPIAGPQWQPHER
jgi:hypothetical protein